MIGTLRSSVSVLSEVSRIQTAGKKPLTTTIAPAIQITAFFRTRTPKSSSAIAGLIFRWFFEYNTGVVNNWLVAAGIEPMQWLSTPTLAHWAISLTIIWKASSFMALMLLAGLQTIPKSLYEAAEVDGASKWQQFREITLPMLRPAIFVALIFRTITAVQTCDIPYAMTGGGPGDSTETLAMYIHKTTLDFLDFGYGSALAALMFVISMVATAGYLRYTRRSTSRSGED